MELILVVALVFSLIGLAVIVELTKGINITININDNKEKVQEPLPEEVLKKFEEEETERLKEQLTAINSFMMGDDDIG